MTEVDGKTAQALFQAHLSTADSNMSSLRISKPTADQVREVRKSLNAAAGTRVVSNEDVVRLSLLTLGVFQELSQEGSDPLTEETADVVMPLMDHIRDAADPDVLRRHLENTEVNEGGRE